MRQRLDDAVIWGCTLMSKFKMKGVSQTLTGNFTIDADQGPIVSLDPGGAGRNVTLPTEEEGLTFWINNTADAAEDLTVKNPATTTIGTVSQNEMGVAFCIGGVWYLRLVGTTT
jgi:hypothetical protein